jgi:hypothetical protein
MPDPVRWNGAGCFANDRRRAEEPSASVVVSSAIFAQHFRRRDMRISILAAATLAVAALVPAARAETTIIKRNAPTVVEKRTVETTGSVGCSTKTKTTTNEFGDTKTVRKESCD